MKKIIKYISLQCELNIILFTTKFTKKNYNFSELIKKFVESEDPNALADEILKKGVKFGSFPQIKSPGS